MADLDIHVRLLPWLWLELLPDHLTVDRVLVETQPSCEFVVGFCHGDRCRLGRFEEMNRRMHRLSFGPGGVLKVDFIEEWDSAGNVELFIKRELWP